MRKKKTGIAAGLLLAVLSLSAGIAQAEASSQVASADEMVTPEDIVDEDMVPIYADELADGTYAIDVRSSSSMFKIADCQLTVSDGKMTAAITLGGDGYLKLYMGTGAEAVCAQENDYISFEENDEGKQVYEVPVEALDMGIDCTAFSRKKEKWYDRVLVFTSAGLPEEAYLQQRMTKPEELGLANGTYLVDVALEGASGKTMVESPAILEMLDGEATVTITWGSANYDYMIVDGEKYLPVNTEGNASFTFPIKGMDYSMPVIADNTALGKAHELEYGLYFDSFSVKEN